MRDLDPTGAAGLLADAIRAAARGGAVDAALDSLLGNVADATGAALAVIVAATEDGAGRHVLHSRGLAEGDVAFIEVPADDGADPLTVAWAQQRIAEVAATDTGAPGGPAAGPLLEQLGLARLTAWPLVVGRDRIDRVVGVLALGWSANPAASDRTPGLLDALADLAAIEIDRARLAADTAERADWAERLAHIDPLTGLANRRTFDRVLELELARAARQQTEVAVAIFDVDAFKATNEAMGRATGDDLLRDVAAVIAEQVRLVDTVARIGGDEFVVVAPGNGGPAVADRVIRAIQALPPVDGRAVSVSAGIARFPVDGTGAAELIGGALDALELARANGRGAMATVPTIP